MKKEFEDYLKERGLPSAKSFFLSGPEIYPASLPREIAEALSADLTQLVLSLGRVVPKSGQEASLDQEHSLSK
jgi:hypothetical protein